jgi:hypothetical protein
MEKLCLKLKYRLAPELIAARYHYAELLALCERTKVAAAGKERKLRSLQAAAPRDSEDLPIWAGQSPARRSLMSVLTASGLCRPATA